MKIRLGDSWDLILITSSEFKLVLLYRKCICIQIVSRYGGQHWTTFTGFYPSIFIFYLMNFFVGQMLGMV